MMPKAMYISWNWIFMFSYLFLVVTDIPLGVVMHKGDFIIRTRV